MESHSVTQSLVTAYRFISIPFIHPSGNEPPSDCGSFHVPFELPIEDMPHLSRVYYKTESYIVWHPEPAFLLSPSISFKLHSTCNGIPDGNVPPIIVRTRR